MTTAPKLADDFADRLDAILQEAEVEGHTDLACLIELALQIAQHRIDADASKPVIVDLEASKATGLGSPAKFGRLHCRS